MLKKRIALPLLLMGVAAAQAQEPRIEAVKAPFYVGQTVMACGKLAGVKHMPKQHYLNLDKPYPNQTLTFLIWDDQYSEFEQRFGRLDAMQGKTLCGRGKIEEYKGRLEIKIYNPQYLRLMTK